MQTFTESWQDAETEQAGFYTIAQSASESRQELATDEQQQRRREEDWFALLLRHPPIPFVPSFDHEKQTGICI